MKLSKIKKELIQHWFGSLIPKFRMWRFPFIKLVWQRKCPLCGDMIDKNWIMFHLKFAHHTLITKKPIKPNEIPN